MNNDYSNFGAYLTHRVNSVLNSTSIEDYKYEPTTLNAANDATRYIPFYDLYSTSRWFKGPDFIQNDSVTKTEYIDCNLRKNSNANVNWHTEKVGPRPWVGPDHGIGPWGGTMGWDPGVGS